MTIVCCHVSLCTSSCAALDTCAQSHPPLPPTAASLSARGCAGLCVGLGLAAPCANTGGLGPTAVPGALHPPPPTPLQFSINAMEPRDASAVLWALAASGRGAEDEGLVIGCATHALRNLRWASGRAGGRAPCGSSWWQLVELGWCSDEHAQPCGVPACMVGLAPARPWVLRQTPHCSTYRSSRSCQVFPNTHMGTPVPPYARAGPTPPPTWRTCCGPLPRCSPGLGARMACWAWPPPSWRTHRP